ncbi:hypothetical protein QW131_22580 [Roseibium salinum]|nr:hypothetical protein [Roseibium salinum]
MLLSAGPDSEAFRSSKEAMETVFNALVTGLIIVRDQDLLPALGASAEKGEAASFPVFPLGQRRALPVERTRRYSRCSPRLRP